jgi:hypothetical protein
MTSKEAWSALVDPLMLRDVNSSSKRAALALEGRVVTRQRAIFLL